MKHLIILLFILLFINACGSGGSSNSSAESKNTDNSTTSMENSKEINEISGLTVAVNNMGNNVEKEFNGFTIVVESDVALSETDAISNDTKAVYGTINGKNTESLLKINSTYTSGYIVVKVYKNSILVGQSEKITLNNSSYYDFGSITTN